MDQQLKQAKQNIRPYLRQITDQQLAVLTAMAQDGKVEYSDHCKCIRGIVGGCTFNGYISENSDLAECAELGLLEFGYNGPILDDNSARNRRLVPMCKAEQRQRERVKNVPLPEVETAVMKIG